MFSRVLLWILRAETDEGGATTAEYALMVSAIAVVLVASIAFFGGALDSKWHELSSFVSF